MTFIPWRIQFEYELIPVYGLEGAKEVTAVILPAILRSFRDLLSKTPPGTLFSETYRTEDERTLVYMTGERIRTRRGESLVLRSIRVGNKNLALNGRVEGKTGERI